MASQAHTLTTPSVSATDALDVEGAFNAYQGIRAKLPEGSFPGTFQKVESLEAIADAVDIFLLDGFGVLNIGGQPVPGAVERIRRLRERRKQLIIVTNAASYGKAKMVETYRRLGYDFAPEAIVSSRDSLLAALRSEPQRRWGLMADPAEGLADFEPYDSRFLLDDPTDYHDAEGFLLIGSGGWTPYRQALLENTLKTRPRPILVGNPDLVAPRENGLTREPGYFGHRLHGIAGIRPRFFGKPFGNIFDRVRDQLPKDHDPARVVMVGDTLHTDILGGAAAGFRTALVTGHGALAGLDAAAMIARSGYTPDYVMNTP